MKVKVFMSGPLRPNVQSVINNIQSIKSQLKNCEIYLLTWAGQSTENIRDYVDYFFEVQEPSLEFINKHVTARTKQQRELNGQLESWTYSIYKMVQGVRLLCELSDCKEEDVVIRIRTDSFFLFKPGILQQLVENVENKYIVRNRKSSGCGFDDWFGITKFKNLRDIWTILDYNQNIYSAWNAEGLIFSRLKQYNIPIHFFDTSIVDCYLLRDNDFKHYYE